MNLKSLKVAIIGIFSLFAFCTLFFGNDNFVAEAGDKIKNKDFLKIVRGYKNWQRIQKKQLVSEKTEIKSELPNDPPKGTNIAELLKVKPDVVAEPSSGGFQVDASSGSG